jgi:hypothetical protein
MRRLLSQNRTSARQYPNPRSRYFSGRILMPVL